MSIKEDYRKLYNFVRTNDYGQIKKYLMEH